MEHVAIQGIQGCFHHEAAIRFFPSEISVLPCLSFHALIASVSSEEATYGVMAIENSLAGTILPNYNLLQSSDLQVVGELYLQIRQHLLVLPGVEATEINEVHSHNMALLQCEDYLRARSWKLVEKDDTALCALMIRDHQWRHVAAVAGSVAAEIYGLDIIASDIHTLPNNYTRFLVLARKDKEVAFNTNQHSKASISFDIRHYRGSLARALTVIADHDINLSKLQSIPIPEQEFTYRFIADLEFEEVSRLNNALVKLQEHTESISVLGTYQRQTWK